MSWVWVYNPFSELIEIPQPWIEILNTWKQGVQDLFFLTPKESIVSSASLNKESACSPGHFSGLRSRTAKVLTTGADAKAPQPPRLVWTSQSQMHPKVKVTYVSTLTVHQQESENCRTGVTWGPGVSPPATIYKWVRRRPVRLNDGPRSHIACEW